MTSPVRTRNIFNRYLLDTHYLIWACADSKRLPQACFDLIVDPLNELYFSAASIHEIAIKFALGKLHFTVDPEEILRGLLANGYNELPISSHHTVSLKRLPRDMHGDPFDRLIVAQANMEALTLITDDEKIIRYCSDYIPMKTF